MKSAGPHILTINGGSSSIKFALFEVCTSLRLVWAGELARIGEPQVTTRPVVTPQLVKRVHALYEELGREVVQAVHESENDPPTKLAVDPSK